MRPVYIPLIVASGLIRIRILNVRGVMVFAFNSSIGGLTAQYSNPCMWDCQLSIIRRSFKIKGNDRSSEVIKMLEWIGFLPLLGLTGNWRGYRMGGKAIGGANMSTDMKKKFEAARAAGNMDQAKALADKSQDVKDARKADGTIKIEKGFYVRDTLVSPDRFNALPEGQKKEILALQKEFEAIGYVDVRTQLGPDQKSRMSKRQQDSMSQRTLKAFEVERKIKEALKPKTQKDAEKRKAEKDDYNISILSGHDNGNLLYINHFYANVLQHQCDQIKTTKCL